MNIVLVAPKIPQNTGSIARTCAATESPLHLIKPIAFDISEKAVRRAGLDYWPHVNLKLHESWEDYLQSEHPGTLWFLTKFATRFYHEVDYSPNDTLVFGDEIKGLGQQFLARYPAQQQLRIPMSSPNVRSLNLSNAVSIVLYEALRQTGIVDAHPLGQPNE